MSTSLGQFIRQRRHDLGLTQEELAGQIGTGVRQAEVSRLEHDRVSLPRRERLEQLAAALEVSMGDLLARTGWMTEGDDLAQELEPDAAGDRTAGNGGEPLSADDVQALVEAVQMAQVLIGDAMAALTAAEGALRSASRTLHGTAGRGTIRPRLGVIRDWESSTVVA